jgi:hypothetical protein
MRLLRRCVIERCASFVAALVLVACACLHGCNRSCEMDGRTYEDGEYWACDCNACSCMDGKLGTTDRACPSDGGM